MEHLKTGEVISKRRKELGLTQNQLAKSLNISFQAVSKWENSTAYPDIEMLPKLAAALHTTVDALLGYRSVVSDYDKRYEREDYYWGLLPNRICYDIMKLLPPIKPYRVLDIGCGEGRNAIFLAGLGHTVDAFDISAAGIEKAREGSHMLTIEEFSNVCRGSTKTLRYCAESCSYCFRRYFLSTWFTKFLSELIRVYKPA